MKKLFKKRRILFLFLMLILSFIGFVAIINNYFSVRVEMYAKQQATTSASDVIAKTITEKVLNNFNPNINENEIIYESEKGLTVNTILVNNILKEVNDTLSDELQKISFDYVLIPYAIIISEVLFSQSDFGIKARVIPLGAYTTDIVTSIEEYGINNTLFKVELTININIEILLPLNVQATTVSTSLPLVMQIVQGEVPPGIWYSGGVIN